MKFQMMIKVEISASDVVVSEGVIGRIAEKVAGSDRLMNSISVFVRDQESHQVQVRLTEIIFSTAENISRPEME